MWGRKPGSQRAGGAGGGGSLYKSGFFDVDSELPAVVDVSPVVVKVEPELDNINSSQLNQHLADKRLGELVKAAPSQDSGKSRESAEIHALLTGMLLELADPYGLRLSSPLAVHSHASRLLEKLENHHCSAEICSIFSRPAGVNLAAWNGGQPLRSSGTVYICRRTGAVHICAPGVSCQAQQLDQRWREQGYFCAITGMFKGEILDEFPAQRRDVPISTARLSRMNEGQYAAETKGIYHADEGDAPMDDMFEDNDGDDNAGGGGGGGKKQAKYDQGDDDDHSDAGGGGGGGGHDFDEVEDDEEAAQYAASVLEHENPDEIETSAGEMPEAGAGQKRRLPATPVGAIFPAPKRKYTGRLAFAIPENPDERTAYFLQNMPKREEQCERIVYTLTSYSTHLSLWLAALQRHSAAAHDLLQRYQRRTKHSTLSAAESYLRWASHVLHHLPPRPSYFPDLEPRRYIEVIVRAWELVASSPYVRFGDCKRFIPNFAKTAVAVLYQMQSGGYAHNCSLTPAEFPQAELADNIQELGLYSFDVMLLPKGDQLAAQLLDPQLMDEVHNVVPKAPRLRKKQIFSGWRLLKECFASWVEHYKSQLADELSQPDCSHAAAFERYAQRCFSLRCRAQKRS